MNSVAITAPSGNVIQQKAIFNAEALFEERGWRVHLQEGLFDSHGRFGGIDEHERLNAFESACQENDLVLCARGGYGFSRTLSKIDYQRIFEKKTWVAGFSDITFFNLAYLAKTGGRSLQAPTASVLGDPKCDPYTIQTFFEVLYAHEYRLYFPTPFYDIETSGVLWGGNLTILCSLLGTPYFPKITGGILFIEEIGEYAYKVERDLVHLLQAGVIDEQNAVILGDFTKMKVSEHDFGYGLEDAFNFLAGLTKTPIISGLPFGHEKKTATLVVGAESQLCINEHNAVLTMKGCPGFKSDGEKK